MLAALLLLCVLVASYNDAQWEEVRQKWEKEDLYTFRDRFPFQTVRYTVRERAEQQVPGRFVTYGNRIHLSVPYSNKPALKEGPCRVYRRRASFGDMRAVLQSGQDTTPVIAFCWREEAKEHWMIAGGRLSSGVFDNTVALVLGATFKLLYSLEAPLLNTFEPTGVSTRITLNGEPKRTVGFLSIDSTNGGVVVDDLDTTSKGTMRNGKFHGEVEIHDHRKGRVFRGQMDHDIKTGWWTSEPYDGSPDEEIEFTETGEPVGEWKKIAE